MIDQVLGPDDDVSDVLPDAVFPGVWTPLGLFGSDALDCERQRHVPTAAVESPQEERGQLLDGSHRVDFLPAAPDLPGAAESTTFPRFLRREGTASPARPRPA